MSITVSDVGTQYQITTAIVLNVEEHLEKKMQPNGLAETSLETPMIFIARNVLHSLGEQWSTIPTAVFQLEKLLANVQIVDQEW